MTIGSPTRRTLGEVEAAVGNVMSRFHRDLHGRGPRTITVTIRGRSCIVHLEGVLTTAEMQLAAAGESQSQGVAMVRQLRDHLVQRARKALVDTLQTTVDSPICSILHDVSPQADVEVFVFGLLDAE